MKLNRMANNKQEKPKQITPKEISKASAVGRKRDIRPLVFYFLLLLLFIGALWVAASVAKPLLSGAQDQLTTAPVGAFRAFKQSVEGHASSTVGLLLLQIVIILVAARCMGWLFAKIKQPTVIGEIVAGILLGPSLLGTLWPEGFQMLFPSQSIGNLELLSMFGLMLFMFTVGMELRLADIKAQARNALIISQASIFIPFILGMALAMMLYRKFAQDVPFFPMTLFMGIAMSITAFPVLARIIQERSMNRTPLGKLALNTAAAGDIFAWLLLAAIMAVSQSGSFSSALFNFLFLLLYMLIIFGVVRPIFRLVGKLYNKEELVTKSLVGFIFVMLIASAYLTELLSMHALFGAFMLGLVMPEDLRFRHVLTEKVEDVSLTIFLPLFFVSSGLKTDLTLINSWSMGLLTLLFVGVAVVGKVGGTFLAARVCGISRKESLYLGAYMNTRGLMELIVLKIGLDLGILPPLIFAILVLMTVVTTVMTTPMIHIIDFAMKRQKRERKIKPKGESKVLIAFARPETGVALLNIADQIFSAEDLAAGVSLLHSTLNSTVSTIDEERYYTDNFNPLLRDAKKLGMSVSPVYKITDDVIKSIIDVANDGSHRMLLIGAGLSFSDAISDKEIVSYRSLLKRRWRKLSIASPEMLLQAGNLFNDKMSSFIEQTNGHVGIFVSRPFTKPKHIVIAIGSQEECNLSVLARTMAEKNDGEVSLLPLPFTSSHAASKMQIPKKETASLCEERDFRLPAAYAQAGFVVLPSSKGRSWPSSCDFLFISYHTWKFLAEMAPLLIERLPPTLIVRSALNNDPLRVPSSSIQFE